jgi:hypothetical protein
MFLRLPSCDVHLVAAAQVGSVILDYPLHLRSD